jgi:hypothetical protein
MPTVHVSYEYPRECGFRHPGKNGVGIYLVSDALGEPCERLPFPLNVCPICGAGIKPARNWTWIDAWQLLRPLAEPCCTGQEVDSLGVSHFKPLRKGEHHHEQCFLCHPQNFAQRQGLLWVGEKFYHTTEAFTHEAATLGVSRKIPMVPHDFVLGQTIVYLAHRQACHSYRTLEYGAQEITATPGIFCAFRPQRVDLVIDDPNHIPDRALHLAERLGDGARLVQVQPVQTEPLPL